MERTGHAVATIASSFIDHSLFQRKKDFNISNSEMSKGRFQKNEKIECERYSEKFQPAKNRLEVRKRIQEPTPLSIYLSIYLSAASIEPFSQCLHYTLNIITIRT